MSRLSERRAKVAAAVAAAKVKRDNRRIATPVAIELAPEQIAADAAANAVKRAEAERAAAENRALRKAERAARLAKAPETVLESRDPVRVDADTINCHIRHPILGWVPFTASRNDVEKHGRDMFSALDKELAE